HSTNETTEGVGYPVTLTVVELTGVESWHMHGSASTMVPATLAPVGAPTGTEAPPEYEGYTYLTVATAATDPDDGAWSPDVAEHFSLGASTHGNSPESRV